ncbi:MAG TPA: hemerythrin domain-containing protein [Anaerolineaceae bacterium]
MEATRILSSEHRIIEQVIGALVTASGRLEAGETVNPEFFLDAANFIQGFADGCHHRKEEGVLFKAMAANGMPMEAGPLAVMLAEHELGRSFNRGMRDAAEKVQAGDASAAVEIVRNARGYADLLRQHILKEDRMLFPLAERVIPMDQQAQVAGDFERVEHEETGVGIHEKYLALAAALVREAA